MSIKEKIIKWLLPDGAVVLTKEEIAALREYAEKHGASRRGGEALEKE